MSADGSLAAPGQLLRRSFLEPQQAGRQDSVPRQRAAYPGRNGAQVFAYHQGAGAVTLERHHGEQLLAGIAHVHAVSRVRAVRYPPLTEQPENMVDADATRVPEPGADDI